MRVKDAEKVLNVSRATVHNWIMDGRLRLNKVLSNGYRDIDEESVYECVAATYEPDSGKNRVVMVSNSGKVLKFCPSDAEFARVAEYLSKSIISA